MNFLKKIFFKISAKKEIQLINKNLASIYVDKIIKNSKFDKEKNLLKHGYKVFSQQDEDGIIDEIFERIGHKNKKFIEIGLETGIECNTTNLLYQNWSGLWIESNKKSIIEIKKNFSKFLKNNLNLHCAKIIPSNVNSIITKYFSHNIEIDLMSIDIGVHTYHVLEAINAVKPRVIVTEYNAKYGSKLDWKVDYDENANWDNTDYFGASLNAFEKMLRKKDYRLVGCNVTGINAFFVRSDELKNKFEENTSSKFHFIEGRYWLQNAFNKSFKIRIK